MIIYCGQCQNHHRKQNIILSWMEQVKFTALPNNAHQKTSVFHKLANPNPRSQDQIINITASYRTINANVRYQQNANEMNRTAKSKKKTLCKNAKAEIVNRNLSKQTLKKLRKVNTQQARSSESEMKGIRNLKSYINSITKVCNKIQKNKVRNTLATSDPAKALAERLTINNLSFADIQQEKIEKQKAYIIHFSHLKHANSKMITNDTLGQEKAFGERLIRIFRHIDRLYEILQEMEALGYYKKHNKSIINFCTINKVWLSNIFLYESKSHKDAFSIKTQWLVVGTSDETKEKLSNFIGKGGKVDLQAMSSDIEELVDYLEQSLGQKRLIEISKLGDYIQGRLKKNQFEDMADQKVEILRVSKSKPEQCNFSKELSQLEERYGAMNYVTKVSRRRFQDLCRTYDKLQSFL